MDNTYKDTIQFKSHARSRTKHPVEFSALTIEKEKQATSIAVIFSTKNNFPPTKTHQARVMVANEVKDKFPQYKLRI